jgi:hypothetical protein
MQRSLRPEPDADVIKPLKSNLDTKEQLVFNAIRKAIIEDVNGLFLKQPQVKEITSNPYTGYCYVAAEAFIYLIRRKNYKPMFLNLPENFSEIYQTHWFIQSPKGYIIDPTADQFDNILPYNLAIGKGFLTKKPSKRGMALIKAVKKYEKENYS